MKTFSSQVIRVFSDAVKKPKSPRTFYGITPQYFIASMKEIGTELTSNNEVFIHTELLEISEKDVFAHLYCENNFKLILADANGIPFNRSLFTSKDDAKKEVQRLIGEKVLTKNLELGALFYKKRSLQEDLAEDVSPKPKSEFLGKDILCEVWDGFRNGDTAYSDGEGNFFVDTYSSRTVTKSILSTEKWVNFEVIENDPQPWFDKGPCPIPERVGFAVFIAGEWRRDIPLSDVAWESQGLCSPVTAYQILGKKAFKKIIQGS